MSWPSLGITFPAVVLGDLKPDEPLLEKRDDVNARFASIVIEGIAIVVYRERQ
jgi:hypothetical protein